MSRPTSTARVGQNLRRNSQKTIGELWVREAKSRVHLKERQQSTEKRKLTVSGS